MLFCIGSHLFVKIKYIFQRGDSYYWQRKPPKDLASRFPFRGPLKTNLNTCDPAALSRKVALLNREFETLCESMRRDPTMKPTSPRKDAERLLRSHGLPSSGRGADELAMALFFDKLNEKREVYARASEDPEEAYRDTPLGDFLSPSEVEAVRLLNSEDVFLLSDVCELYLKEHRKSGRANFAKLEGDCRRAFNNLTALVGDKAFRETTRDDAKSYRDNRLAHGNKGASVRRTINVLRAAFQFAIHDKALTLPNVWNSLPIRGEGDDIEARRPFSLAELDTLARLCREADDSRRWLLALQADTGTRLGEVVGLRLEDLRLDAEVPHLVLCEYPGRTLKNKNSARLIPLLGLAKWAACRVVETAKPGQVHAFPDYVRHDSLDRMINANAASGALNKWLRAHGLDHGTHDFRHAFKDRMRNALVPEGIQKAVGGWGRLTHADGYGDGHLLRVLHDGLLPVFAALPQHLCPDACT